LLVAHERLEQGLQEPLRQLLVLQQACEEEKGLSEKKKIC
jgi:hypothetical protein